MAMTLGNLIDFCQQAYNAVGDGFFTTPWYISMIWRAETELCIEGWVIEETLTNTSVSGTRELAWPSNVLGIKEVKYDYKNLAKVPLRDDPVTTSTGSTGTPRSYAIWNNTVILYPTPSATGDQIQLRCYMAPDQLAAITDPLNVPDEYQIQLSDYVLAQMAFKDQNMVLGSVYMQTWKMAVEKSRQQRRRRLRADKNACVRDVMFCDEVLDGYRPI